MQACLLTVPKYFQQIMGWFFLIFEVEVKSRVALCAALC